MITFHIGFQKTGSTFLQRDVFPKLEGCAFVKGELQQALVRHIVSADDDEYNERTVRGFCDDLQARDDNVLISGELLSGPMYGNPKRFIERIPHRISQAAPEARIIMFIRRQPDMLRAFYSQYIHVGGALRVEQFLDPKSHLEDDTDGPAAIRSGDWMRRLEYDQIYERYTELMGEDDVLAVPYEKLASAPEETLEMVASFIGSKPPESVPKSRRNPSLSGASLGALRAWNRFGRKTHWNPSPMLNLPGGHQVRKSLQRVEIARSKSRRRKPESPVDFMGLLPDGQRKRYEKSNARLADVLPELKAYDYPGVTGDSGA